MGTGGKEDKWRLEDRRTGRYSETVGQEYLGRKADRKTKGDWWTGRYREVVGTGFFYTSSSTKYLFFRFIEQASLMKFLN
jgi:hypothetical protein